MGRRPCCFKIDVNRGAWTVEEDKILVEYVKRFGEGCWRKLPIQAGLNRCGKGCRLRWLNYLRPNIKRGNISQDEDELIVKLHKLLGNRWSLIAGRLPGRTDNEIKNYWKTTLSKKETQPKVKAKVSLLSRPPSIRSTLITQMCVLRPKAFRCTKLFFNTAIQKVEVPVVNGILVPKDSDLDISLASMTNFDLGDFNLSHDLHSELGNFSKPSNHCKILPSCINQSMFQGENLEEFWNGSGCDHEVHNEFAFDPELDAFLDEEIWLARSTTTNLT